MRTSRNLTRRAFIKGAAGLLFSTSTLNARQNEPVSAQAKSCVIACRDSLLKATKKPDSWSAMKELGVTGVEVEVNLDIACPALYHPKKKYSLATLSNIKALKDDLSDNGLVISAFLMHNRLDQRLEQEIAWMKRLVAAAQKLDVKVIRIDVVPHKIRREKFLPCAIEACKRLCEIVEETSIRYGIENHGSVTNAPGFLEQLFNGVGSPHLGLTLDTANFYWYGQSLDTGCSMLDTRRESRIENRESRMGWKYNQYSCPIYEGDIDFRKVAAILRKAKYNGDLCLENESLRKYPESQHVEILKKEIALLKNLSRPD